MLVTLPLQQSSHARALARQKVSPRNTANIAGDRVLAPDSEPAEQA